MVVCPKCGSNLQARKLLFLTNLNSITCPVCSSKLAVKNKGVYSAIGGVGGGLGGALGGILAILLVLTGNMVYLGLLVVLVIAVFLVVFLFSIKLVKLKLELSHML